MTEFIQLRNISVAELVIKYLELEGITHVFGIPGGYINPFLEILREHPTIKLIISRHEEGAAFMADGYARATGKLGVIFTTAGPGATNALTGIACAKVDHSPLMLIVGQPSTAISGYGAWQDSSYSGINICEIFRHVCRFSEVATHAENFPSLFARALRVAHGTPKQTVHISFPINISASKISNVDFPLERNYIFPTGGLGFSCNEETIEKIFSIINQSKNPVIMIGSGCTNAFRKPGVLALFSYFVTRHNIPVMTTPKAKGLFPETHQFSLGVFGLGGSLHSDLYLEKNPPDTVIVLGSSLNEWASQQWDQKFRPSKTMIQVDIDATHIGRVYLVHYALLCDIEIFIHRLIEIDKKNISIFDSISRNENHLALFKKETSKFLNVDKMHSNDIPLKPQRVFYELSNFSKDKEISFFLDIGNSTGFFSHYTQLGLSNFLYSAYGFTCMGWSNGAAIGAKLASPDSTCIAIMGDGAFLMNGVEIQTATRYNVGVIYMVMFDDAYGMVNHGMNAVSKNVYTERDYFSLGTPDLVKFSESLGADSYLIDKPEQLQNHLTLVCKNADIFKKPQILIVKIDPNEQAPFGVRHKALQKVMEQEQAG
ncbi:MAG TPA: thiamine pyrophosphate-binding protein [Gammaproteobacteria bacterium]|nr:thiamine pyrophosphate-binding protein [Gammaproteobacteria bacterium]